ncbi:MAG: multiheme c-type cytochrome, partial [Myxococcota bacterium]
MPQPSSPRVVALWLTLWAATGCPGTTPSVDVMALRDPVTCQGCHPEHYREWAGSMHAYASVDPVFVAMNARAQTDTAGALGDFCVRCHAPMAWATGATTDGLNLASLPASLQGVGCVYCHSVTAVEGTHNNPLVVQEDGMMRGGIRDPFPSQVHGSLYSKLHDRDELGSSALCGACHDLVVPSGLHLERGYAEWQESLYAKPESGGALSCSGCHMPGQTGPVASVEGAPVRRRKSHAFPGVDVALIDFPERETQAALVQRSLDNTLGATLCVEDIGGLAEVSVDLENLAAGHAFPSGATQDRRVWVEVRAFLGAEEIYRSGVVEEGVPMTEVADPSRWELGHRIFDENDDEVLLFWEAYHMRGELLPAPTAASASLPGYRDTHVIRTYLIPGLPPDRVTMRVLVRPIGLDILDELIESGDLS